MYQHPQAAAAPLPMAYPVAAPPPWSTGQPSDSLVPADKQRAMSAESGMPPRIFSESIAVDVSGGYEHPMLMADSRNLTPAAELHQNLPPPPPLSADLIAPQQAEEDEWPAPPETYPQMYSAFNEAYGPYVSEDASTSNRESQRQWVEALLNELPQPPLRRHHHIDFRPRHNIESMDGAGHLKGFKNASVWTEWTNGAPRAVASKEKRKTIADSRASRASSLADEHGIYFVQITVGEHNELPVDHSPPLRRPGPQKPLPHLNPMVGDPQLPTVEHMRAKREASGIHHVVVRPIMSNARWHRSYNYGYMPVMRLRKPATRTHVNVNPLSPAAAAAANSVRSA